MTRLLVATIIPGGMLGVELGWAGVRRYWHRKAAGR